MWIFGFCFVDNKRCFKNNSVFQTRCCTFTSQRAGEGTLMGTRFPYARRWNRGTMEKDWSAYSNPESIITKQPRDTFQTVGLSQGRLLRTRLSTSYVVNKRDTAHRGPEKQQETYMIGWWHEGCSMSATILMCVDLTRKSKTGSRRVAAGWYSRMAQNSKIQVPHELRQRTDTTRSC